MANSVPAAVRGTTSPYPIVVSVNTDKETSPSTVHRSNSQKTADPTTIRPSAAPAIAVKRGSRASSSMKQKYSAAGRSGCNGRPQPAAAARFRRTR